MPIRSPSTRTTLPKCPMIPGKLFLLLYFWSFRICSHIFLSKHHSRAPRPRPLRTTRLATFSTSPAGSFEIVKKKKSFWEKKRLSDEEKKKGVICMCEKRWMERRCLSWGGKWILFFPSKKTFSGVLKNFVHCYKLLLLDSRSSRGGRKIISKRRKSFGFLCDEWPTRSRERKRSLLSYVVPAKHVSQLEQ